MSGRRRKVSGLGFTLLELMIVVVIIGILASVAIPMITKYLKKSKTSEAALNLRKIYDGEIAYYVEERIDSSGGTLSKYFIAAPSAPSEAPGIDKRTGNWEDANWSAIKFNPDGPVLYQYSVQTGGVGTTASFTARAVGDIDGDGTTSLFERVGSVNSATGGVEGGAAIYMLDELE